jgi:hypothetical protein
MGAAIVTVRTDWVEGGTMAGQLCPLRARPIEPGENVAFREGGLRHMRCIDEGVRPVQLRETCPSLKCAICSQTILADEAARHFRGEAFHEGCWVRRARTIVGGGGSAV